MCNVGGHCILGREEAQKNRRNLIFNFFLVFLCCCCCSVAQLCLSLCDPMDCSMQASLSFTITQSLLKLMSIELVMPSIHLILCHPLLLLPPIFPSIRGFFMSQHSTSGGQSGDGAWGGQGHAYLV